MLECMSRHMFNNSSLLSVLCTATLSGERSLVDSGWVATRLHELLGVGMSSPRCTHHVWFVLCSAAQFDGSVLGSVLAEERADAIILRSRFDLSVDDTCTWQYGIVTHTQLPAKISHSC